MKKNYFLVMLFGLFSFAPSAKLLAQEGITQYALNGETISYVNSKDRALVEFTPNTSEARMLEIVENLGFIKEHSFLPSPKLTLLTYDRSITWETVSGVLSQYPEVVFVSRGLIYEDGTEEFALNSVFVQLKENRSIDKIKSSLFQMGISQIEPSFMPGLFELNLPKNSGDLPRQISNLLLSDQDIAFVEPDMLRLMKRLSTNDPAMTYQWSLNNTGSSLQYNGIVGEDMNVFPAWNTTTGSSSIKVAVLDEGVDLVHPDLLANLLPGYDAFGLTAGAPINDDAHGTACAGIIASVGNNNLGTAGVAYNCKIIPVRIAYSNAAGNWVSTSSGIGGAITWAWQTAGADILSNSWGGGSPTSLISVPFANATNLGRGGLGAPVLAAAGNSNVTTAHYPSSYPEVMSVAAMSMCGQRKSPTSCDGETWWGSNYGPDTDVAAPGVKIYATDISGPSGYSTGDYVPTFNGTSSACPNAAGVMALVLSANLSLTESQARTILESTAEKAGGYSYTANPNKTSGTWSNDLGYGRVNAQAAVLAATGACSFTGSFGTQIGANSAVVTFTPATTITPNYYIEYGVQGFATGAGTSVSTTSNILTLSSLASNTTYDVDWYLICAPGDTSAELTTSFTTPCGTIMAPYTQDFTSSTLGYAVDYGACWTTSTSSTNPRWEVEDAEGINENSSSTGPFYDNTSFGTAGGKYMYLETSTPSALGDSAILLSPLIDISGLSNVVFQFYYHMYGSSMGTLHVDIANNGVWNRDAVTIVGQQQTSGGSPWLFSSQVLSGYSSPIQLRFRGEAGASFYSDMSIDDISVSASVVCNAPLIVTASQTSAQANFSWTPNGSGLNYNIAIKPQGQALTVGDIGFTSLNQVQYALGGLIPNTTYIFYLRDSCGLGNVSPWETSSFVTPCTALALPYLEDFNTWPPSCWDLNGGTQVVTQDASGNYMEGNFWTWSAGQTGYALSPSMLISSVTSVDFEWAHLFSATYPNDQLLLLVHEVGTSTWDTLVNLNGPSFTSPGAASASPPANPADFISEGVVLNSSYIGKTVEFRFDFNSGFGPDVYVDNFSVEALTVCFRPNSISNQIISSTAVLVSWSSTGIGSVYELEYDTAGFFQSTGSIVTTTDTFTVLTGLNLNTGYDAYVRQRCGSTLSNSRGTSFTTPCDDYALPYTEDFDVWPPSCWSLDLGTQIVIQSATGGHMEGDFWSWLNGQTGIARSPRIWISQEANVSFDWAHLYHTSYPNDELVLMVREVGTSVWDTLSHLYGPSFTSPNAQNDAPPTSFDFIAEQIALDASYVGKTVEFQFNMNSGYGPDVYVDNFSVQDRCADASLPQISSVSFLSAPRSYNVQFTTPGTGDLMSLQVREVGSSTWKTPKTWTSTAISSQNFLAESFGTTNEVRIGMRSAGVWTYSCPTPFDAACAPMTVNAIELVAPFCAGDSALLKGIFSGGYKIKTFLWNTGETTRFIYGQQGQTYQVVVTDEAGCSDSASVTVSTLNSPYTPDNFSLAKPNAVTFIGSWTAPTLITGVSLIGYRMQYRQAGVGAAWRQTSLSTNTSATVNFTGTCDPSANYEFAVFARVNDNGSVYNTAVSCRERKFYNGSGGCAKTDNSASDFALNGYGITVYPNPTNASINVGLNNEASVVELLDMNGKLLFSQEYEGQAEVIIDLADFASGVYMLNISNSEGIFQERVVKN